MKSVLIQHDVTCCNFSLKPEARYNASDGIVAWAHLSKSVDHDSNLAIESRSWGGKSLYNEAFNISAANMGIGTYFISRSTSFKFAAPPPKKKWQSPVKHPR